MKILEVSSKGGFEKFVKKCGMRRIAGAISTALEGDCMGQDVRSSVPVNKKLTSSPLMYALLTENSPDYSSTRYFKKTQSTLPEKNTANNKHDASSQVKQVKSLPRFLHGQHTKAQILDHSGRTYCQPLFSLSSLRCQMASECPTDDQIRDFIEKRLARYTNASTPQSRNYASITTSEDNGESSLQYNSVTPHPTSVSEEYVERQGVKFSEIQQYSVATGQALKDDSSKFTEANVPLTPKSTVASKKQTGTLASATEHSKRAPKNETVKKSASINVNLPFKKHMNVTMFTNAAGKSFFLDEYGDKTFLCIDENFHSKWIDKYIENGMANLHYSLPVPKELTASLEKVKMIAEVENFSEVILQEYWDGDIDNIHLFTSTEYPQILVNVAGTCTRNEDESPVVLTAVPPVILDELTKKHLSSSQFNCGLSYEEYNSPFSNMSKNLDVMNRESDFSQKRDIDPKSVEPIDLNKVQDVTDVSEEFQSDPSLKVHDSSTSEFSSFLQNQDANTKIREINDSHSCHITCKEITSHPEMYSSIKIVNVVSLNTNQKPRKNSFEEARKNAVLVHSQRDLGIVLSENEVRGQPSKSENNHEHTSLGDIKAPEYEDISDCEDTSHLLTKLVNSEQEELRIRASFEDVHYEDISDDENPQIQNIAGEESASLKKLPENSSKRLTFKNEGHGNVTSETWMNTKLEKLNPKRQETIGIMDTDQLCSSSSLVNIADGIEQLSCPKRDGERPLESQTNCNSLCSHFSVLKDETADHMDDDDWIVLPLSISDLKYEPEEEAPDDPGVIVLQDSETESLKSLVDTCSKEQMLHQPASDPGPAIVHSQIEEFDTIKSFLESKTAQFRKSSRSTPIKEMDSTTEPHKAKNMQESYSESENNCETDENYSTAPEHNYLTPICPFLKTPSPVPSDKGDSVPAKEIEHRATHVQVGRMRHSGLQKLKELMDKRPGSKHVQPNCNKQTISKKEDIIIIDSDTEDESDQICKKTAKRKRLSSSSEDTGDLACSQQRGHLLETVDDVGGTFKKLQENIIQPCLSKRESNRKSISTQESIIILDSDTEDESDKDSKGFFLSHLEDSGKIKKKEQLIEAKGDKKKATMERILPSRSDNSGSASITVQNRHASETMNGVHDATSEKPQKKTLLFKGLQDKVPESLGKEVDSLCRDPVIPRLSVQTPSESSKCLKLAKDSKGTFGKDKTQPLKTSTATHKKGDSLDLDKSDQDRCVPESKSVNKSHYKKKTQDLVSVAKGQARVVSRQPSFSSQEGPSASINTLTSPDGQLSEIRRSSAFSKDLSAESSAIHCLPKSKPSTSGPTYSRRSAVKRSLSCSNTSTLQSTHSATHGPPSSAPIQLPARKRASEDWANSFPPWRDRRSSLGNARPKSSPSRSPRQRHNSHKATPPLMKKTKLEAIQRTKEINRDTSKGQRKSVGKGFKL